MLAIFDKPDPLEGPYFEETLYVTPSRLPAAVLAEVARITAQGCPSATVTWASCSPAGSPGAFEFSLREADARLRVRIEPSLRPAREAAGVR